MKFRGHETFFIRKGWLSKGMKYVEFSSGEVFIDKEKNPMDVLGIGSNMVKSLRYWLLATNLTKEQGSGKRIASFSEFGKLVYKNDPYQEETGTLQLLHYKLASNKELATSWYYFFNEFNLFEFTADDFISGIKNFIKLEKGELEKASGTDRTLGDDFACIVNSYFSKRDEGRLLPENNISSPFLELGLLSLLNSKRGLYKKATPLASSFNPYVVLAIIADYAKGKREIRLNELLTVSKNIGRIFNLDTITLLEVLRLTEKSGELKIVRTAGLDVIQLKNPQNGFLDYVKKFYASLNSGTSKVVKAGGKDE